MLRPLLLAALAALLVPAAARAGDVSMRVRDVPLGLGVAVWLVEYGKSSRFAHTVRFFIDVLTGVPSIMFGLFIYIALIVGTGTSYAAYKGAYYGWQKFIGNLERVVAGIE